MDARERAERDALLYAGGHLLRIIRLLPAELAERPSPVTGASFVERLSDAERMLREVAGSNPRGEDESSEVHDPAEAGDRFARAWSDACRRDEPDAPRGRAVAAIADALLTAAEVWPAAAGDRLLGDLLRHWTLPGEELERRRRRLIAGRERRLRRIRALR